MGNLYFLLILEALDLLLISIKGSILPPVCLHKREESVDFVILRGWEIKNIEDESDLGSGPTMLPSASYWRPWSSKAWESSWPITTPIAPEDFHNNQSSPFSISEIDDDSLSVEFELSLSMKIWIWPKLRLGGLAMLKKGACNIPAGKAIWVRDAAT